MSTTSLVVGYGAGIEDTEAELVTTDITSSVTANLTIREDGGVEDEILLIVRQGIEDFFVDRKLKRRAVVTTHTESDGLIEFFDVDEGDEGLSNFNGVGLS